MSLPFNPPHPPYYNPTPNPENFKPSRFVISNITKGVTTTVTTTATHNYIVGQEVRILVPFTYGMPQITGQSAYVLSVPSPTSFVVNINSIIYNNFIGNPSVPLNTKPQVVAIGDVNTGIISSTGRSIPSTAIPGSFQNISS